MKLRFAGLSDQGLVRSANQDAYCIDSLSRFFIVADGMGGHAGGEEASRIATQAIREFLEENWSQGIEPTDLLRDALTKANQSIIDNQQAYPERADMGTTVVVVMFPEGQHPWCVHVGDSRLYLLRDDKLNQVTEDHTWVAQAVQAGILMPDQARIHPWRHVLAQCLGREDIGQVQVQPITLQAGDKLLLCSDGLTEEVGDEKIESHLSTAESCDESAKLLVTEAKTNGGRDNITVVVVGVDELPPDLKTHAPLGKEPLSATLAEADDTLTMTESEPSA